MSKRSSTKKPKEKKAPKTPKAPKSPKAAKSKKKVNADQYTVFLLIAFSAFLLGVILAYAEYGRIKEQNMGANLNHTVPIASADFEDTMKTIS